MKKKFVYKQSNIEKALKGKDELFEGDEDSQKTKTVRENVSEDVA